MSRLASTACPEDTPYPDKKGAPGRRALEFQWERDRSDDVHLAVGLVELDGAVAQGEQRPIAADAHALAGVMLGAALTDDDAAGEDLLTAIELDAEAL